VIAALALLLPFQPQPVPIPVDPSTLPPAVETAAKLVLPAVDWVSVGPITILVAAAFVLLVMSALLRDRLPKPFMVTGTIAASIAAALATIPLWKRITTTGASATIGQAIKVDGFGVFLTITICSFVVIAALMADDYLRREDVAHPEFFVLMLLSAAGGITMAVANDLIVLFLGLEILSIALYVLAGSHPRSEKSKEAALKYFVLGAFSSAVLLYGMALVYGATGTTNLSDMNASISGGPVVFSSESSPLLLAGMVLLIVGLGFKVAAVPFHMWTPDVYQGSPTPATGFMAAVAKAAGFAGLFRILVAALGESRDDWWPAIFVVAIITMIVGSILAVVQTDVKRMMAYSSISHAGFILVGLDASAGSAGSKGVSGALFYLFAYGLIVLGSFTVIAIVAGRGDSEHGIDRFNGLGQRRPVLAVVFTLFLLAQAGIPGTSGFIAKFGVISASVDSKNYVLAIIAMLSAVVAASFYLRIVMRMFTADVPSEADGGGPDALYVSPGASLALFLCAAATIVFGLLPQLVIHFAERALL
jgi:NADH-quinone oxidoreductase subunit N